jgi:hypothetical protein
MYKWIKKNQKKMLAVFAVLLMIAFVATLGPGNFGSGRGTRQEVVVGHVNGEPLYDRELQAGKDQWQILMRTPVQTRQSFGQSIPLPYGVLPFPVVEDIQKHPELFVLLQREAASLGYKRMSEDEARSFWVNQLRTPNDFVSAQAVQAVAGIFQVGSAIQSLGDVIKVSQPMWRREAAQQYQGVRLNLVDFRADEFEKQVPAPTPQQLQEHFEKYKNTPPRQADSFGADDSLGFGYQIAARVKVQYFEIPYASVVGSLVFNAEVRHEWEVKAADYWLAHQEEFKNPATQPATHPATGPAATQAAATQAAATLPAIKPFPEVKGQIVEKLMADDVAKKTASIEKEITAKLAADWLNIRRADPSAVQPASTQPASTQAAATQTASAATQPATTQPTDTSLARLEQIRAEIQKSTGVSVNIRELNDWQDAKQLAALPGIGTARTTEQDSFAELALHFTGEKGTMVTAVPLQVWEPSQPLMDASKNAYVFRLTAAQTAHAPPDITPVLAQVTKDWRTAQAFEMARAAAAKLAESAKTLGLAQASRTAGVTMITTGPFSPRSPRAIQGYLLTDMTALQALGKAATKLLEQASQADPHPSIQFELPTVRRAGVAELASAQLEFPEAQVQYEVVVNQKQANMSKLATEYFSYDNVVERLNYKVEPKAGT